MIKNDQITFKQLPPPILNKVLTIRQPENDLIYEHWRNLMAAIEVECTDSSTSPPTPTRNIYLLYKCKYHLAFANFQDNCMLYQRKFKIIHGQTHEITALKLHLINIKFEDTKKKEILVGIGFFDGSCEVHNLVVTEKSVILKKLLFLESNDRHDPITSIVFNRKNLYLARLHHVALYRDVLTAAANIIIQDEVSKSKSKEITYRLMADNIPIEALANGTALSIANGINSLYVFNELDGARAIDFDTHATNGSIIDSLVNVKETYGENLVLGDTSNYLKIIYYSKNYVERFAGFKNYCSAIDHVLFPSHEEVWVGDLNGSITYFQRCLGTDPKPPNKFIRMVEVPVKYSVKACENGIKEMRAIGKLLFILDTESNLHIFDIVRKDALEHMKTVELESVEEYSSNEA